MKKIMCRLSALVLVLIVVVLGGCTETLKTATTVADIAKHGNLILNMSGAELFEQGFEHGDLLEVTVAGQTWEVPLCSNYSDVDNGLVVLRASSAEDAVVLAINMGDFATTAGIATKSTIEEEPGYRWDYALEAPVQVEIANSLRGQQQVFHDTFVIHVYTSIRLKNRNPGIFFREISVISPHNP